METVTITKTEYTALKRCQQQYNKLRELVNRFDNHLPSGANPAPVKAKKLTNKMIISRFEKHFEKRKNTKTPK